MNQFFLVRLVFLLALACGGMLSAASVSNLLHWKDGAISVGGVANPSYSATSYVRMVYSLPKYNPTLGATVPAIYVQQALVRRYYANNPSLSATMAVDATTPLEPPIDIPLNAYGDQPCISADGNQIAYRYTEYDATTYQPIVRCIAIRPIGGTFTTPTIGVATYFWREGSSSPTSAGSPITAQPANAKVDCRNPALNNIGTVVAFSSYNSVSGKYLIDCNPGGSWADPVGTLNVYRWKGSTNGWDGTAAFTQNTYWDYFAVSDAANVGDADYPSIYTTPVTALNPTSYTYVAFSCGVKNTERWCSTPADPTTIMRMEMEAPFVSDATYFLARVPASANGGADLRTGADGFYGFNLEAKDPSIFLYNTFNSRAYEISQTASVVEYTQNNVNFANFHRLHAHTGLARRPCLAYDATQNDLYASYETTGIVYAFGMTNPAGGGASLDPINKKINFGFWGKLPTNTALDNRGTALWDTNNGWDVHMRRLPMTGPTLATDPTRCLNWTVTGRDFPCNSFTGSGQDSVDNLPSVSSGLGRLITRLSPNDQANFQGAEIGIDTTPYWNGTGSTAATFAAFLTIGDCAYENSAFTTLQENVSVATITTTGMTFSSVPATWRIGYILRVSNSIQSTNNGDWTIQAISGVTVTVKEAGLLADSTAGMKVTVLRKSGPLSAPIRRGPWATRNLISFNRSVTPVQRTVAEAIANSEFQPATSTEGGEWQYLGSTELIRGNSGPATNAAFERNRFMYLTRTSPMVMGHWLGGNATDPRLDPRQQNYVELIWNPIYKNAYPAVFAALDSLVNRRIKVLTASVGTGWCSAFETMTLAENPPPGMTGHIDGIHDPTGKCFFRNTTGANLEPDSSNYVNINIDPRWAVSQMRYPNPQNNSTDPYLPIDYTIQPFQIKFWRRNPILINQNLSRASLSNDGRFALYQSLWLPKFESEAPPVGVKNEGSEYISLRLLNPIGPCDTP